MPERKPLNATVIGLVGDSCRSASLLSSDPHKSASAAGREMTIGFCRKLWDQSESHVIGSVTDSNLFGLGRPRR